jgi:hypothetical protein
LLIGLFALCLATRAFDEVLLFWVAAGDSAFWELLLGALVRLAYLQRLVAEGETLLGLLGQILVIRLRFLFWLSWRSVLVYDFAWSAWSVGEGWISSTGVRCEAGFVLGLRACNFFASFLVVPFCGSALLVSPALRGLLLVWTVSNKF